jgi:hypothetical protein
MGRHSAPGGEDESADAALATAEEDAASSGRHSRPEDAEQTGPVRLPDDQPTQQLTVIDDLLDEAAITEPVEPPPADAEAPVAAPAEPPTKTKRDRATAADLALLRSRPDVRARCIAAVVVPFVLYVVAMLIVGAEHVQYLLWLWIPLILGLALAGHFLDVAHKRQAATPAGDPAASTGDRDDRPA